MKKILALLIVVLLSGCATDADLASHNLSKAADMFQIERRIVFLNGITDNYILSVEGRCSIKDSGGQLEVTCKTSETGYKKHFLGLSDNVTYFAEQLDSADVSVYRYKVIFKPTSIIPDIDLEQFVISFVPIGEPVGTDMIINQSRSLMKCQSCNAKVNEQETSFAGLHIINDCYGRVYFPNGREFLGSLKRVDRKERASDRCSLNMEAL